MSIFIPIGLFAAGFLSRELLLLIDYKN